MLKSAVVLTLVLGCYKISAGYAGEIETPGENDPCEEFITVAPPIELCKFHLYLRDSATPRPVPSTCEGIWGSLMEETRNTLILVNGDKSADLSFVPRIKEEIDKRESVNLISFDWRNTSNEYDVSRIQESGNCLSEFIKLMMEIKNIKLTKIHIVGFSLGAHVAGWAGNNVKDGNKKVARITGLDPARGSTFILSSEHAEYVELIHTDGGPFGYGLGEPRGHSNFYANNGKSQPGCSTHICCHNRAYLLFAASMTDRLIGQECKRDSQLDLNLCKGEEKVMGNNNLKKTCLTDSAQTCRPGVKFRVNTKRKYPFYE